MQPSSTTEQSPGTADPASRPVVCVVGAGPGLGLASARAFAAAGYDVTLLGRREQVLADLAARVGSEGHGADVGWVAVDVADPAALSAAVERAAGRTGRLDVLHHNVSVYRAGHVADVTAEQLLADVAVGVGSLLTAVTAALPALAAAGGSVVLTGSGVADRPAAGALTLGVQKAAVRTLLLGMAGDLAGRGVHAATLTVRGVLAAGTRFDPDLVAARLVGLAAERHGPRASWTVLHDFDGDAGAEGDGADVGGHA